MPEIVPRGDRSGDLSGAFASAIARLNLSFRIGGLYLDLPSNQPAMMKHASAPAAASSAQNRSESVKVFMNYGGQESSPSAALPMGRRAPS